MLTAMSGFTTQNCRVAYLGNKQDRIKQGCRKAPVLAAGPRLVPRKEEKGTVCRGKQDG